MSSSTQDKWDIAAKAYPQSTNVRNTQSLVTQTLFEQIDLANPISRASAILDVGSGPGNCLAQMIQAFDSSIPPDARLIASDFSEGMIQQIRERQRIEQGGNLTWQRVEARVMDAQELEGIENSSISHITGTHVYNLVENGRKAVQAACRVLKPGGVVGMTLLAVAEWMDLMALAATKIRGEGAPHFELPPSFSSLDGIKEEFKVAGLETTYVAEVESNMDVTDPSMITNKFIRGRNPGALVFVGGYSEAEMDRFVEEWLRLVHERYPTEPRVLKGTSIVAIGRK